LVQAGFVKERALEGRCDIGADRLIGIGATIMDGCVVGAGSIVAGGSFLKEGTVIPPHSIVMGSPGGVTKTRDNAVANAMNAFLHRATPRLMRTATIGCGRKRASAPRWPPSTNGSWPPPS